MKRLFLLIEFLLLFGLGYQLYMGTQALQSVDLVHQITLEYNRAPLISDHDQQNQDALADTVSYCVKLEEIELKDLAEVYHMLQGWRPKVETGIIERYKAPRFLVYLEPLHTETARKAFIKQFRQQGYTKATPVRSGALAGGIVIDAFESEQDALKMLDSMPNPMQKVRVIKEDDIPSDQVDIVVRGGNQDQRMILSRLSENESKFKLKVCE